MTQKNHSAGTAQSKEPVGASSDLTLPISQDVYLGMTLKDRYLIEKEIGRGGMGIVYLARDKELLSRPVVIKVLLAKLDQNHWPKIKFRHEMEALARIDHPGVVGVFDAGEAPDGKSYLVMQFVAGMTLRSIEREEGMDFERVAHLMRQVCQALSAAHDQGVCHCDLKPENIMLQSLSEGEEIVKLIDFGIARVRDSRVAATAEVRSLAGTIAYMAPEQLEGKPVAASDIYALGVIAYEMLTGRRPFNPESPFQLLEMQRAGVRVKPKDLRPGLPETAQNVILKALSPDPQDRYGRARDFGEELARALTANAHTGLAQTPVGTLQMAHAPGTKPRGTLKWTFLIALLMTLGIAISFRLWREEARLRTNSYVVVFSGCLAAIFLLRWIRILLRRMGLKNDQDS